MKELGYHIYAWFGTKPAKDNYQKMCKPLQESLKENNEMLQMNEAQKWVDLRSVTKSTQDCSPSIVQERQNVQELFIWMLDQEKWNSRKMNKVQGRSVEAKPTIDLISGGPNSTFVGCPTLLTIHANSQDPPKPCSSLSDVSSFAESSSIISAVITYMDEAYSQYSKQQCYQQWESCEDHESLSVPVIGNNSICDRVFQKIPKFVIRSGSHSISIHVLIQCLDNYRSLSNDSTYPKLCQRLIDHAEFGEIAEEWEKIFPLPQSSMKNGNLFTLVQYQELGQSVQSSIAPCQMKFVLSTEKIRFEQSEKEAKMLLPLMRSTNVLESLEAAQLATRGEKKQSIAKQLKSYKQAEALRLGSVQIGGQMEAPSVQQRNFKLEPACSSKQMKLQMKQPAEEMKQMLLKLKQRLDAKVEGVEKFNMQQMEEQINRKQRLLELYEQELELCEQELEQVTKRLVELSFSIKRLGDLLHSDKQHRLEKNTQSNDHRVQKQNNIGGNTTSLLSKVLYGLATRLSQQEHGNHQQIISGHKSMLSSMQKKSKCKKNSTSNSNVVTTNTIQSPEKEMELKLRLINNNQINDDASFYQESEFRFSDTSTYYSVMSATFLDHQVTDDLAMGIDSDETSLDRDVRIVRRKKITDPSPVYRQQFYAKRTWRYEQTTILNAMNSYLSTSAQSSVDADESDYDIDTCSPAIECTRKQQKCKIGRKPKGILYQAGYSSSEEDSHWSIILERDLKD